MKLYRAYVDDRSSINVVADSEIAARQTAVDTCNLLFLQYGLVLDVKRVEEDQDDESVEVASSCRVAEVACVEE
jgi:hypothetical protein